MKKSEVEYNQKILEYKKHYFLSKVKESAGYMDYPIPKVKFWETYNPSHFNKGERAHIHLENNTICISEPELEIMTEEDINETATHEVSHLKEGPHNQRFYNIKEDTKLGVWKPPMGIGLISVNSNSKQDKISNKKKTQKPDKLWCNYHLCNKKITTFKCKFCGYFFCKEHFKPRVPNFANSFTFEEKDSHPCFVYINYLEEKKKRENEEYKKALETICKRKKEEVTAYSSKNEIKEKIKRIKNYSLKNKTKEEKSSLFKRIKDFLGF